jgi:hypothetical protein
MVCVSPSTKYKQTTKPTRYPTQTPKHVNPKHNHLKDETNLKKQNIKLIKNGIKIQGMKGRDVKSVSGGKSLRQKVFSAQVSVDVNYVKSKKTVVVDDKVAIMQAN